MNETTIKINFLEKSAVNFTVLDYIVFTLMLLGCAAIGLFFAMRGKKNVDAEAEYLMGGRNMKVFPISMSLVASFISGITLLGSPTEAYIYGTQYFFIIFIVLLVCFPAGYVFLPVFHGLELASTYEYLERRFDRKVRYFGSVSFTISLITWLPIVIYVPALAFNQVTGMNIHIVTPCVSLVCIFYTALGGLKAVVWTDVIQSIIMVGAIVLVVLKGTFDVGGFTTVWDRAWESNRIELPSLNLDFTERHTVWSLLIGGTLFWLQVAILNQNMIQRYLALPSLKKVRQALWIFIAGVILITLLCGYSGLLIYATYHDCDPLQTKLAKAKDQLLPLLVGKVLGRFPGMPGLFVAGIFSAALSSLSTGLNSMSAVFLEDFVKPTIGKQLSNITTEIIMKGIVFIFGALCVGLVFVVEHLGTVFQLSMSLSAISGGPLLGVFSLGMLFPWANAEGAFYGGILGLLTSILIVIGAQGAQATGNLLYHGKSLSVKGCDPFYNFSLPIVNATLSKSVEAKNVFFLFKMSYLWYPTFSSLITFISGGILSFLMGATNLEKLDPKYVAPFVRKYLPPKPITLNKPDDKSESMKMMDGEVNQEKI